MAHLFRHNFLSLGCQHLFIESRRVWTAKKKVRVLESSNAEECFLVLCCISTSPPFLLFSPIVLLRIFLPFYLAFYLAFFVFSVTAIGAEARVFFSLQTGGCGQAGCSRILLDGCAAVQVVFLFSFLSVYYYEFFKQLNLEGLFLALVQFNINIFHHHLASPRTWLIGNNSKWYSV